jgi:hypothetical protein
MLHVNSEELLHRSLGWTSTGQSEMVGLGPAQFKKEKKYLWADTGPTLF